MSNGLLSKVDHKGTEKDDMRHLKQSRGPGKSWVFSMLTPPDLIGLPNPWDGKPLGKELKKGLARVHHRCLSRNRNKTLSAQTPFLAVA